MSVTVTGRSYILTTATQFTLMKWNSDSALTDPELVELEHHFDAMVTGAESLGARYGMLAMMLRMELKHVRRLRKMLNPAASSIVEKVAPSL